MVLAIALVAVLFLTTTSFYLLQCSSKRNRYINEFSSGICFLKSALDIAEDFLNDGKLNLPTNIDDSKYYVFYYDASGNVQVKDFQMHLTHRILLIAQTLQLLATLMLK